MGDDTRITEHLLEFGVRFRTSDVARVLRLQLQRCSLFPSERLGPQYRKQPTPRLGGCIELPYLGELAEGALELKGIDALVGGIPLHPAHRLIGSIEHEIGFGGEGSVPRSGRSLRIEKAVLDSGQYITRYGACVHRCPGIYGVPLGIEEQSGGVDAVPGAPLGIAPVGIGISLDGGPQQLPVATGSGLGRFEAHRFGGSARHA
jgi:hypothetical protein